MSENKIDKCVDLLQNMRYSININSHSTTKTSPYIILMGFNPNFVLDGVVDSGNAEVINYVEEEEEEKYYIELMIEKSVN